MEADSYRMVEKPKNLKKTTDFLPASWQTFSHYDRSLKDTNLDARR